MRQMDLLDVVLEQHESLKKRQRILAAKVSHNTLEVDLLHQVGIRFLHGSGV